jgi:hypothetical protein
MKYLILALLTIPLFGQVGEEFVLPHEYRFTVYNENGIEGFKEGRDCEANEGVTIKILDEFTDAEDGAEYYIVQILVQARGPAQCPVNTISVLLKKEYDDLVIIAKREARQRELRKKKAEKRKRVADLVKEKIDD